jgi:hypothetical protein
VPRWPSPSLRISLRALTGVPALGPFLASLGGLSRTLVAHAKQYAAAIWLTAAAFVRFYEEPALTRRFGADYEAYRRAVPEALDGLDPEERHRIYRMLRLQVVIHPDARLEASGVLGAGLGLCQDAPLSRPPPSRSWPPPGGSGFL